MTAFRGCQLSVPLRLCCCTLLNRDGPAEDADAPQAHLRDQLASYKHSIYLFRV